MANTPSPVKQADVTRYVKAVVAAGISVGLVRVAANGSVEIYPEAAAPLGVGANPWDQVINAKK